MSRSLWQDKWVRMLAGGFAALALSGCAGASPTPATSPAAQAAPPASPSSSAGSDTSEGISAEEAQREGVFTGAFDARLTAAPAGVDGRSRVVLKNVGSSRDTYVVSLDPAGVGTPRPSAFALDPGSDQVVVVDAPSPVTVHVRSAGRGDVVADLEVP